MGFCQQEVIRSIQVPPYLQRANGVSKRLTQTILNMSRRFLITQGGEWFDVLHKEVALYKNLPHDVMKMSPNMAMFGQDLRLLGVPSVVLSQVLPAKQLVSLTSFEVARMDVVTHTDCHTCLTAFIATRRV